MIDCVKCFLEINQDHTCEQSFLEANFNFVSKVRQTSVCGVMLPKSRLIFIQNIIFVQKFLCLVVDYSFNYLGKQQEKGNRPVIFWLCFSFLLVYRFQLCNFAIIWKKTMKSRG